MEFENPGLGKCVLLKECDGYNLIYSVDGNQFVVAADLNKITGSWQNGSYYGEDLDGALADFNKKVSKDFNDIDFNI